jgi:protein SMG7
VHESLCHSVKTYIIFRMRSISPKHNEKVAQEFHFLVSDRYLSIEMILNTIVLAQGALWKHRMIRDPTQHRSRSDSTPILIEWSILDHLLDLYRILLDVGKKELTDSPEEIDLGLKISAIFRRMLPALRIASKWLCTSFKYLGQDQEFAAFQAKEKAKNSTVSKSDPNKLSGYSVKTIKFWKSYASFVFALSQAFPLQNLPSLEAPLEEDIEMRGFLPLRNLIFEGRKAGDKTPAGGILSAREQVHPNVEQLMRISDLLEDAKSLLSVEVCFRNTLSFHFGITFLSAESTVTAHQESLHFQFGNG